MGKSSKPSYERAIKSLTRRILLALAAKYALNYAILWIFLWGVTVLALRAAYSVPRLYLLWGIAGVAPTIVLAVISGMKRMPPRAAIRAVVDHRSECGGLLMAAADAEIGEWRNHLPVLAAPKLTLRARRSGGLVTAGLAFLIASFFAPVRFDALAAERPLDVEQHAEHLQSEIQVLQKEEAIEESRAESLEKQLDAIKKEASGEDPVKTWEALDHMNETVSGIAKESAEKMTQTTEELAKAQALGEALAESGSAMDPKLAAESMKQLASLMEAALGDKEALERAVGSDVLKGLNAGSLSKQQLEQLAKALDGRKGDIAKRLQKLREARLIDAEALEKCENAGKCDSRGLAAFLKENAGEMSVEEAIAAWERLPGRGGVDRGRADAEMTWTNPSSEKGVKFKEQLLPSGNPNLDQSQLVERSIGAPSVNKTGSRQSGALSGATAGGGSAFTQNVLPRHKGAVKRYFDRP